MWVWVQSCLLPEELLGDAAAQSRFTPAKKL